MADLRMTAVILAFAVTSCGGGSPDTPTSAQPPAPAALGAPAGTGAKTLSNASGPCLVIDGEKDRVIEGYEIGPCGGDGIEVRNSTNITIRDTFIHDTKGVAVHVEGSRDVVVEESGMQRAASGVYALNTSGMRVLCNSVEDVQGPKPRGQAVQFDKVTGGDNQVRCNTSRNQPGRSSPEDAISLYQTRGSQAMPIIVADNLVVGGGPSTSGGGIMLGDSGGAWQVARGNVLVDPGQYGIAVSGGDNQSIINNRIYARSQSFTNVGIYAWNQSNGSCTSVEITGNKVAWRNAKGSSNPWFNGENCGGIAGVETNDFNAAIGSGIEQDAPPGSCSCISRGWR